jgi:hypothetical protein
MYLVGGRYFPTIKIIKQPACFVKYYKIFAITHSKRFGNEIILFLLKDASTGFLGAFTGIFKGIYKKKNPLRGIAPRSQRENKIVFITQSS